MRIEQSMDERQEQREAKKISKTKHFRLFESGQGPKKFSILCKIFYHQ
jgi:hypothetical protein